jgi:hypothetical protein
VTRSGEKHLSQFTICKGIFNQSKRQHSGLLCKNTVRLAIHLRKINEIRSLAEFSQMLHTSKYSQSQ